MTIQEIMTSLKEWLLNKFAQKDGNYASLNSGTSNDFKKIGGGAEDGWLYRKCPQDNIGTGARLEKIKGKTLAWNQLANCSSSISGSQNNVTWSYANNTLTIVVGTGGASASFSIGLSSIPWIVGHKYLFSSGMDFTPSSNTIRIGNNYYQWLDSAKVIWTCPGSNGGFYVNIASGCAAGTYHIYAPMVCDLTLLYGSAIDGLTDAEILAKFESEFPGYHSYESGKLISNDAESIETVGFNQWDEEWELGSLQSSTGQPNNVTTAIRVKNFIPVFSGETYYLKIGASGIVTNPFFYDANKNFIGRLGSYISNTTFVVPSGAIYMKIALPAEYGTTYNHDICINLSDPAKNGTYEPYRKSVMQLGLNSIKVKSHNIWDEEWEVGGIDVNTGANNDNITTNLRGKNYIPVEAGKSYYFKCPTANFSIRYYNAEMGYITYADYTKNTIYQIPSDVAFIRFVLYDTYGTTYNNDVCINVSSSFNGQYEPHGDITITGGLKSAGDAKDEIVGNKYIKRVGSVDLGTLTWGLSSSASNVFYTADNIGRKINSGSQFFSGNGILQKYVLAIADKYGWNNHIDELYDSDKSFCLYNGDNNTQYVHIHDSAYSDAASFKAAMNGVMLYYELATPIEYELVDAIPCITQYSEYGTQRIISPQSSTPSAPFMGEWQYGIQQGDFISGLENSEFMIGSSTYIISEEEFNEIFGDL